MPQMAPMMLSTLMLFFIMMMIIMVTLNYVLIQSTPFHYNPMIKTKSINWKS